MSGAAYSVGAVKPLNPPLNALFRDIDALDAQAAEELGRGNVAGYWTVCDWREEKQAQLDLMLNEGESFLA